jgi:prepilin-type processing-associated H-X9-DG protein
MNNIKQLEVAMFVYAGESKDKLPDTSGTPWAWDMPWLVGNIMLDNGVTKKTFYCPGTRPRFDDNLNFGSTANGSSLWYFNINGIHVMGYVAAFNASALDPASQNTSIMPESNTQEGYPTKVMIPATDRVLFADATLNEKANGSGSWADVAGGFSVHHLSPHLTGLIPSGANVGFKDGHVKWRQFKFMLVRTAANTPSFWW